MLAEDIHSFRVIYEIQHGVTAVANLFGDFLSNVYAAKVSESSSFLRKQMQLQQPKNILNSFYHIWML